MNLSPEVKRCPICLRAMPGDECVDCPFKPYTYIKLGGFEEEAPLIKQITKAQNDALKAAFTNIRQVLGDNDHLKALAKMHNSLTIKTEDFPLAEIIVTGVVSEVKKIITKKNEQMCKLTVGKKSIIVFPSDTESNMVLFETSYRLGAPLTFKVKFYEDEDEYFFVSLLDRKTG